MALTKVRLPVADIAAISNGSSKVDMSTSGGDVVVTVGGTTIATFSSTGVNLGSLDVTTTGTINSQDVLLSQGAVAAKAEAATTQGVVGTTSAHPLSLIANAIEGLSIATDGQVTLGVEGTATDHLVTKSYVDGLTGLGASDFSATTATTGSLTIPNSTGNDLIINWGQTGSITNTQVTATFDTAFPNAYLVGFVSSQKSTGMQHNRSPYIGGTPGTTSMVVAQPEAVSKQVNWLAIGY